MTFDIYYEANNGPLWLVFEKNNKSIEMRIETLYGDYIANIYPDHTLYKKVSERMEEDPEGEDFFDTNIEYIANDGCKFDSKYIVTIEDHIYTLRLAPMTSRQISNAVKSLKEDHEFYRNLHNKSIDQIRVELGELTADESPIGDISLKIIRFVVHAIVALLLRHVVMLMYYYWSGQLVVKVGAV